MKNIDVLIPSVGESITEVTLSQWVVNDGDIVIEGQIICEVDSDKATLEVPAQGSGKIKLLAEEDTTYEINAKIAEIDSSVSTPAAPVSYQETEKSSEPTASGPVASPAAKKILGENSIDPTTLNGSGKDGRITKEDALKAKSTPPASKELPPQLSNDGRQASRQKMTRLRKTIAKRLVTAKNETAMLTTFNEVDMTGIMELRAQYKEAFKERHGVSLGFMSFFTKACCLALQKIPEVGAMIDGEDVISYNYADVGIAVSAPKGLVVPVVRDADKLTLAGIEKEIVRLATKARDGKLTLEEMQGGNFTITNGGVFGSMLSTPIINIPQSAILGMHNIVKRPHVINDKIEIRPIMFLALSYDHRLIDGRESVTFLVTVKTLLENPAAMLLDI